MTKPDEINDPQHHNNHHRHHHHYHHHNNNNQRDNNNNNDTNEINDSTKTNPNEYNSKQKREDDLQKSIEQQLQAANNQSFEIMHPKLKKILKIYRSESQKSVLGPSITQNLNESSNSPSSSSASASTSTTTTLTNSTNTPTQQISTNTQSLPSTIAVLPTQQQVYYQQRIEYDFDNWSAPPPNSIIKNSEALTADTSSKLEKCDAYLHGERITCFIVGGEKRLCLPEMLNYVLKDFTVQQINTVCEKLHIYCSRCTHEQLEALKTSRLLPLSAPSCGLITLTDAERLCHVLLGGNLAKHKTRNNNNTNPNTNNNSNNSNNTTLPNSTQNQVLLKVYHRCFGRTYGIIYTNLYTNPNAQCIECDICHLLYSPQNFVVHTHKHEETRICHWGFNSMNWRLYLNLVNSYKENEKYRIEFENFKYKFTNKRKSCYDNQNEEFIEFTNSNENLNLKQIQQMHNSNNSTNLHSTEYLNTKKLNSSSDIKELYAANITNEHKLLNDILSKPIDLASIATVTVPSQAQQLSTLTQNSGANSTITTPSNNYYKQPNMFSSSSTPLATSPSSSSPSSILNQKILSSIYDGQRDNIAIKKPKYSDDEIETLLESFRNEIDANVKSPNSRERLTNYTTQIQEIYDEKLIRFYNKNRSEIEEYKHGIQLENETLRNRLKIFEIENQLLRAQLNKFQHQIALYNSISSSSSTLSNQNDITNELNHHNQTEKTTTSSSSSSSSSLSSSSFIIDDLNNNSTNITTDNPINLNENLIISSSPQQQAAAIALMSLHSPTAVQASPIKSNIQQRKSPIEQPHNKLAAKLLCSNLNQSLINNNNYMKCESSVS